MNSFRFSWYNIISEWIWIFSCKEKNVEIITFCSTTWCVWSELGICSIYIYIYIYIYIALFNMKILKRYPWIWKRCKYGEISGNLVSEWLLFNAKLTIFQQYHGAHTLYSMKWWWCLRCIRPNTCIDYRFL